MEHSSFPILIPITLDDLHSSIRATIREEMTAIQSKEIAERLLSPEQACKVFDPQISKNTLKKWSDEGLIPFSTFKRKIFYKYSELIAAGKTLKKYKR